MCITVIIDINLMYVFIYQRIQIRNSYVYSNSNFRIQIRNSYVYSNFNFRIQIRNLTCISNSKFRIQIRNLTCISNSKFRIQIRNSHVIQNRNCQFKNFKWWLLNSCVVLQCADYNKNVFT